MRLLRILAIALCLLVFALFMVQRVHAQGNTISLYLQTMDSCKQAVPGAIYQLTGNGVTDTEGPGPGTKPVSPSSGSPCVLQHGNCVTVPTGCAVFTVPAGAATYTITETQPATQSVLCLGGSDCPGGPDIIMVTVAADGTVSATVENIYPNRSTATFGPWPATSTNPIVVHNSKIATTVQSPGCDNDGDADDYTTGSEGGHQVCDSDSDKLRSRH